MLSVEYLKINMPQPITQREEIEKQGWKDEEYELSLKAADRFLDEPYSDPDDDIRTISRQFIRSTERMDEVIKMLPDFIFSTLQSYKEGLMKEIDEVFNYPCDCVRRQENCQHEWSKRRYSCAYA